MPTNEEIEAANDVLMTFYLGRPTTQTKAQAQLILEAAERVRREHGKKLARHVMGGQN